METPSNTNNNSIMGPIIASLQKEFTGGLNELKDIGIAALKRSITNKIETNSLLSNGNKLLKIINGDNKNVDAIKGLQKDLSVSSKSSIAAIKEQSKEFQGSIDNLSKVVNQPSIIKETVVNNEKETVVKPEKETVVKPPPLPKMFERVSLLNAPKLQDPVAQAKSLKVLKKMSAGGLANSEELKAIRNLTKKANKTESDSFSFEKMTARKLGLNKKEDEAEAAKKGKGTDVMFKEAIQESGWLGKILGSIAFFGGAIVGFFTEFAKGIKTFFLKIEKGIYKLFPGIKGAIVGMQLRFEAFRFNLLNTFGKGGRISKLLGSFGEMFKRLDKIFGPIVKGARATISGIITTVKLVGGYIGNLGKGLFDLIKPVFNVIKGLTEGSQGGKFFTSILKFFKIGVKVGGALAKGIPIIGQIIMIIEGLVYGVMGAFKGFTETEGNIIQKIAGGLIGFIKGAIKGVFGGLINLVIDGIGWLGGLLGFDNFKEMLYDFDINKYIGWLIDIIAMPFKLIIDFFSDFSENMKKVGAFFVSIGDSIMGGLRKIGEFFEPIGEKILDGFNEISSFFASIGQRIINSFNAIGEFFSNIGKEIESVGSSIKGFLKSGVISLVKTVWDFIVDGVKKFFAMSPVGLISGAMSGNDALQNIQKEVLKNVIPDPNKKYDKFSKESLMLKVMPDSLLEFVWGSKPSAAEGAAARGSAKVDADKVAAAGNPEAEKLAEDIARLEAEKQEFNKKSVTLLEESGEERMKLFGRGDAEADVLSAQSEQAQRKANNAAFELKQKREELNLLLNGQSSADQLKPAQMDKTQNVDSVSQTLSESGAMNAAPVVNVINNNGGNVTNNSSQSTQNTIAESTDNVLAGSAMAL